MPNLLCVGTGGDPSVRSKADLRLQQSGQLFRSTDGGENWTKLKREFGEVRSTICQPLP